MPNSILQQKKSFFYIFVSLFFKENLTQIINKI